MVFHCGQWISDIETNRDHVPSRGLLKKPYPDNLPVVQICKVCNQSFSVDEEYLIAFLAAVLAGTTDAARLREEAAAILHRSQRLRERIERSKTAHRTKGGETVTIWKPEEDRVRRVIIKNARGHAFYEMGEPMLTEPQHAWFAPIETLTCDELQNFMNIPFGGFWPEVGSRLMTHVLTGQDLSGGWVIVQDGVYR